MKFNTVNQAHWLQDNLIEGITAGAHHESPPGRASAAAGAW